MSAESIFLLELDAVMDAVARLPPFPEVALQLLQSLDGADADSEQLERLIATDQILTARLLRVANSSFYGMQGRIHSIRDALVLIGYRGLRSLAIAASLSSALPGAGGQPGGFWRQGLAAGVVAQVLGRAAHLNPDVCFAAGLMHGLGRLLLARAFPAQCAVVEDWRREHDCMQHEAERAVLGLDHLEVGQLLAERWRFPAALVSAIGGHQDPVRIAQDPYAALVHVADAVVIALDVVPERDAMVPCIDEGAWRRFVASPEVLLHLLHDIDEQIESAAGLLQAP